MYRICLLVAVFLLSLPACDAAYAADRVTQLPGFSGALPFSLYAGYLNVPSSGSQLFYVYASQEALPINNAQKLTMWMNGGPGCSSLDGLFAETGPFAPSVDGQTVALMSTRWTQSSHMLFIENPVGVGFSYSPSGDYAASDTRSASENFQALLSFFTKFPELASLEFHLAGESYAGVYIPTLAQTILQQSVVGGSWTGGKMTGIMVGNGCNGWEVGACGGTCSNMAIHAQAFMKFSFLSSEVIAKIQQQCDFAACLASTVVLNSDYSNYYEVIAPLNATCQSLIDIGLYGNIDNGIDIYGVFDECLQHTCAITATEEARTNTRAPIPFINAKQRTKSNNAMRALAVLTDDAAGTTPKFSTCFGTAALTNYLNRPDVQTALHAVKPPFCWDVCSSNSKFSYDHNAMNLPRDVYPYLIGQGLQILM